MGMGKAGVSYPRRGERVISTRNLMVEDGHGIGELLSWANLLPVGIWSCQ